MGCYIQSLPSELTELHGRREPDPVNQHEQNSWELTETKAANTGLHSTHVLYGHIMAFKLSVFMGLVSVQTHGSLILLSSFGFLWFFFLLAFLVFQFWCDSFCFIYYVLLLSLRSMFFSNNKWTKINMDERGGMNDLESVDRGKTIIRMYYVLKESISNKN